MFNMNIYNMIYKWTQFWNSWNIFLFYKYYFQIQFIC